MSFNIEVRKKQLHSLNQYITSSKDKVESILNYLGWTGKRVFDIPDKINCPINIKHIVPIEKIEKHVQQCCLSSAGYKADEEFLSEPQTGCCSVVLDGPKKIEILNEARQLNTKFKPDATDHQISRDVRRSDSTQYLRVQSAWNGVDPDPMTSDRLVSTFSTDERLAMYDYCVAHTVAPEAPTEFLLNGEDVGKKEEAELTEEERLERERNAKRRPVKYKSVHTGRNKSHTEVMREVIQNQMELLQDHLKEKQKAEEEAERKRQQELIEKAQAYEQFPHIDSTVVYDYGIDPFEVSDNSFLDNGYNGSVSYNVHYDYDAEISLKIDKDSTETKVDNNHVEKEPVEKRDDYRNRPSYRPSGSHRDRDRRPRSRERDYRRSSDRRSRERRDYPRKRGSYFRSERRH